jgi:hypothetical protein
MPALAPVEGSLSASPPGGWAESGIARIEMSPSKPRMGEKKLSKAYIQTIKVQHLMKTKSNRSIRAPYRVPFYSDKVEVHFLISQPTGGVLE